MMVLFQFFRIMDEADNAEKCWSPCPGWSFGDTIMLVLPLTMVGLVIFSFLKSFGVL
jgi:hypothetical protein